MSKKLLDRENSFLAERNVFLDVSNPDGQAVDIASQSPGHWVDDPGAEANQTEYSRLKGLAQNLVRRELRSTLTATDLVHELILKVQKSPAPLQAKRDDVILIGFARRIMKQILIDRARRRLSRKKSETKSAEKRESTELSKIRLDTSRLVVDLDDCVKKLAELMPENAELVRLRIYDELSIEVAARRLGMSRSTAYRKWTFCKAWLASRLQKDERNVESGRFVG